MSPLKLLLSVLLLLALGGSGLAGVIAQDGLAESVPATEQDPTVATDWMMLLYELVRDETVSAPAAARLYGYAGVALYEAVSPGIPGNWSAAGQIAGMPLLPYPEEDLVYDWPSVANAALATTITGFFPDSGDDIHDRIAAMRQQQLETRLQDVDEDVVEHSHALGDDIGSKLVAWMASDGYASTRGVPYEESHRRPGVLGAHCRGHGTAGAVLGAVAALRPCLPGGV